MRIVVTGANGFIGQNLCVRLSELGHSNIERVTRATSDDVLRAALASADFVFHLAGVNRPTDVGDFERGNREFTATVCAILEAGGRPVPIAYTSSTQAALDNPYGRSKLAAEQVLGRYAQVSGAPVFVLRLTNVFGKWSRPNYNSAVATFCYNLTHGLPITIHDPTSPLSLVYIDDVVAYMIGLLGAARGAPGIAHVGPTYETTVGEVAAILRSFVDIRQTLLVPTVGAGLTRALYATYLSYLPASDFAYPLERHADARGVFVEMLKTGSSGQTSYFTARPGITRGEHYHHTKAEKFLVVKGTARFGFRHIVTNETHEIVVTGDAARVVETVPGWAHDITNIGDDDMVVLLWANEVFDPDRPDTIASKVAP